MVTIAFMFEIEFIFENHLIVLINRKTYLYVNKVG